MNLYEIRNTSNGNGKPFRIRDNFVICENQQSPKLRFANMWAYKSYFNSVKKDYDAVEKIFIGFIHKEDRPVFIMTNSSSYGWDVDYA